MRKALLVLGLLLLFAPAVYATDGYQIVTWYQTPDLNNPIGQEVIPIECGTASSWGTTGNYKVIDTYDCNDQHLSETCWRWLFGAWRQQYC
ncbi:MAG: hypothetical protein ACLGH0_03410 [Thermoanaerobaculia bacterium]